MYFSFLGNGGRSRCRSVVADPQSVLCDYSFLLGFKRFWIPLYGLIRELVCDL